VASKNSNDNYSPQVVPILEIWGLVSWTKCISWISNKWSVYNVREVLL